MLSREWLNPDTSFGELGDESLVACKDAEKLKKGGL